MIGRELKTSHGLLEWVLQQEGKTVSGYTRAIFSGFTTAALAQIIRRLIREEPDLDGVWHVASEPVSKFKLLALISDVYGLKVEIKADNTVTYDRSLDASKFHLRTKFVPRSWPDMVDEMFKDSTPYSEFRRISC
jgi:dTDP-4-dehydrorhamnose reductase